MSSPLHDIVKNGRDLAKSTRDRYLRDIDDWIEFAGTNPNGWTRERVQAFYSHLLDERKLKPQSANRQLASLQYASRWYARNLQNPGLDFAGLIQRAKSAGVKPKLIVSTEEAIALLNTCNMTTALALRDRALFVVLLETGMRVMSITSMTIGETLLSMEMASMRKPPLPPYPSTAVLTKGSNGERMHVPLSDTACAALDPWMRWLAQYGEAALASSIFQALDTRVTMKGNSWTPSGSALSPSGITKIIDTRARAAGLEHINPHRFRHTFVTWRTNAGLQPIEIAAVTGHSVPGIGAMAGYMNMIEIGAKVRNTTPQWLRDLVGV